MGTRFDKKPTLDDIKELDVSDFGIVYDKEEAFVVPKDKEIAPPAMFCAVFQQQNRGFPVVKMVS